MKKLDSMPIDERLKLIFSSKELTERMNDMNSSEVDLILDDYLRKLEGCSYSFGCYADNILRVKDERDFLLSFKEIQNNFCFTDKIHNKFQQCWKLYLADSNLLRHHVEALADMYEEYLNETIKYYEGVSYDIYCKDDTPAVRELLDLMDCNEYFSDVYVRDDGRLVCEKFLN